MFGWLSLKRSVYFRRLERNVKELAYTIWEYFWSIVVFMVLITLASHLCKCQSFNGITSLRDLHRTCPRGEGLCYYFAEDSDVGVKDPGTKCVKDSNCAAIVSIERFQPQDCSRSVQPELNKIFCCEVESRGGELFQVTIGRHVEESKGSCYIYRRNCIEEEFVAIAFSTDSNVDAEVTPYFTCISKAAYVQSILQNDKNASQLTFTTPFPRMAAGTFWSHIADGDDGSLLCTFLISTGEFHYMPLDVEEKYVNTTDAADRLNASGIARDCSLNRDDFKPDLKFYKPFKFGNFGWTIKLARGRVERVGEKNLVQHVRIKNDEFCATAVHGANECDSAKIWTVSEQLQNASIPERNNSIPDEILDPDETSKKAMEKVHRACIDRTSLCYQLQNERGCLHKQNCHLLVAITSLDENFDNLRFDIIVQTQENGEHRYVRPKGWGAWALSVDKKMGNDFVFTCSAVGQNTTKIYPTLNVGRANLYFKDQPYQDLVQNTEVLIWKREPELEPRVLCSFEIPTVFNVTNLPIENSETPYDLKEGEYFVLMAQGTSVADSWSISYHTVNNREVSDQKFSRKIYKQETSGTRQTRPFPSGAWKFLLLLAAGEVMRIQVM